MGRPRTFSESEVLDCAKKVFSLRGYAGATMSDLASAMAMSAPSIYAAFGDKRHLFKAVARHLAGAETVRQAAVLESATARDAVSCLLNHVVAQCADVGGPVDFLFMLAWIAVAQEDAELAANLTALRQAQYATLHTRFVSAQASGDLAPGLVVEDAVNCAIAAVDGLGIRAADGSNLAQVRQLADQLLAVWQRDHTRAAAATPVARSESERQGGRGRRREFSVSLALGAAMEVFWRKGYDGATLTDLTQAMEISRPSLYAFFGSKEELFLKALNRYQEENMAYGRAALLAPTAREVVEQLLAGAIASQMSDTQPRGCFWIANAMRGGDEATLVRAEVLKSAGDAQRLLTERLLRASAEGDLPAAADPQVLALLLGSVLQGIATLGAAGASRAQLDALAQVTLDGWPSK